jgi:hypothetical protein
VEELLICPPELSGNTTSSHLVANQEELGKGNYEFSLQSDFLHTIKSCDMGLTALLPL